MAVVVINGDFLTDRLLVQLQGQPVQFQRHELQGLPVQLKGQGRPSGAGLPVQLQGKGQGLPVQLQGQGLPVRLQG